MDPIDRAPPPSFPSARRAGFIATGVALTLLWVVSGFISTVPFPPTALAGWVIRQTPGDVATFFIEAFQHWAMRLLAIGSVIGALVAGAELLHRTHAQRRRAWPAAATLGVLALVASFAAPSTDLNLPLALGAITVACGAFILVARALLSPVAPVDETRRAALRVGAGAALGVAAGGTVIGWLARRLAGPDTNVVLVEPAEAATIPARADFPEIPGLTPEITTPDDHYVVDINFVRPTVEAESWSLKVFGLVDRPAEYTFEQLQESFEVVQAYSVLSCISNEVGGDLVGHSAWGGVRLADVLETAGAHDDAHDVVFRAADGYSDSITLDLARDPNVLLAVSQSGEPLTQAHGFPCRVRIPGIYGMKNVKWVTSIEVVPKDYIGYWQTRGWSDIAKVRTQSRIDVVTDVAIAGEGSISETAFAGAETWIAGIAWAGDRGVSKVEISTDDGATWDEAMLKDPISPLSWRLWAYRWTPDAPGESLVSVRATDGTGEMQAKMETDPHPLGATGFHTLSVRVVGSGA
jgi:DMSO/TMAO reductase YedYZ molybdopterin-dependent catalytic subunit